MLFNIYLIIMGLLILSALALNIALRVSPKMLNWFDEWLEPIRDLFNKEDDEQ